MFCTNDVCYCQYFSVMQKLVGQEQQRDLCSHMPQRGQHGCKSARGGCTLVALLEDASLHDSTWYMDNTTKAMDKILTSMGSAAVDVVNTSQSIHRMNPMSSKQHFPCLTSKSQNQCDGNLNMKLRSVTFAYFDLPSVRPQGSFFLTKKERFLTGISTALMVLWLTCTQ